MVKWVSPGSLGSDFVCVGVYSVGQTKAPSSVTTVARAYVNVGTLPDSMAKDRLARPDP